MDPYREGLVAEEYAANGWMGSTPDYVEFHCEGNHIIFNEFPTGMLFNGKYMRTHISQVITMGTRFFKV